MTRRRQKTEERLFAERAIALLGKDWTIREPDNEREWPDLLIETPTGSIGLEVRKIYPDEAARGSSKRAAESSRRRQLKKVANNYYDSGAPPVRVQIYGWPNDTAILVSELSSIATLMQIWERKKITFDNNCWVNVCRLPDECAKYNRWDIVSDSVGWVGALDSSVVQQAIQKKSANIVRYKVKVEDVRLLLVCDRTRNSGKLLLRDPSGIERAGFNHIYLLSFPDELFKI